VTAADGRGTTRVSIITPCLNPGDDLRRCIDSVQAQGYPSIEHIVVDAASTDGTVDLLAAHRHLRWVSQPDDGQADAINKGFAMATGHLLTWLNADDVLEPGTVAAAVAAFERTPSPDVIYGDCRVVDGNHLSVWRAPARVSSAMFDCGRSIPQPGTFMSRRAVDLVSGVDPALHLAMDFDLWLRLADAGAIFHHLQRVTATFYVHPESKTGSTSRAVFLQEEARSLRAAGREAAASIASGRAHAYSDRSTRRLPAAERAGAHLEEARLARSRGSVTGALRHLAAPAIWRSPTARGALLHRLPELARRIRP
jgi:GT2 family glycosyltransferase